MAEGGGEGRGGRGRGRKGRINNSRKKQTLLATVEVEVVKEEIMEGGEGREGFGGEEEVKEKERND